MRGNFLGVPIVRIIVCGVYIGLIYGNYHLESVQHDFHLWSPMYWKVAVRIFFAKRCCSGIGLAGTVGPPLD